MEMKSIHLAPDLGGRRLLKPAEEVALGYITKSRQIKTPCVSRLL